MSVGFFNQLGARNRGIGGLASGMDTEAVVRSLMSASRARLASQQQQRQTTSWRIEAYRSVRNELFAFQGRNISMAGGASSLRSSAFFNNFTTSSNSSALNVRSTSNSVPGSFEVNQVTQLARHQTFTTRAFNQELTSSPVEIGPGGNFVGQTLTLQMGATSQTIRLDSLTGIADGAAFETELQRLVTDAFGTRAISPGQAGYPGRLPAVQVNLNASGTPGSYTIGLNGYTSTLTVMGNAPNLGFTGGQSNRVNMNSTVEAFLAGSGTPLSGDTFQFSINDVTITANRGESMNAVLNRINNSTAGVNIRFNPNSEQFVITAAVSGEGNNLRMHDVEGNFLHAFLGAPSGNQFSSAGTFTQITQTATNTLQSGLEAIGTPGVDGFTYDDLFSNLAGRTMRLEVGGITRTFNLNLSASARAEIESGETTLEDAIIARLNEQVTASAGFGPNAGVEFSLSPSGQIVFESTRTDVQVRLLAPNNPTATNNALGVLGLSPVTGSTASELGTTLESIGVEIAPGGGQVWFEVGGGVRQYATLTPDMTIGQAIDAINAAVYPGQPVAGFVDGRIVLSGDTQAIAFGDEGGTNFTYRLFGASTHSSVGGSSDFDAAMAAGRGVNAEIIMDGRVVVSSTNTFSVNGTEFDVTATSNDSITVSVAADPGALVDKIRGFIDEYNALVDMMHGLVSERPNRAYQPLTDEQRAEMTREEIELWEEQARRGVIGNSGTVRRILDDMRSTLFHTVEAAGLSLMDIGISTESTLTNPGSPNNGRLELTQAGEARLRQMIETNPDAVRMVFQGEDGLASRLDNVIQNAIRTSSENRGSLVIVAGTDTGLGNQDATLVRRVDAIDRQISSQQARMEREFDRLWRRFTAMESAIARVSAQSGWLEQFTMQNMR